MKFLKKLATFILVVLVIAAIFAIVIAMNWELFSAMPQQMERMQGAAICSALIFVSVQGKSETRLRCVICPAGGLKHKDIEKILRT